MKKNLSKINKEIDHFPTIDIEFKRTFSQKWFLFRRSIKDLKPIFLNSLYLFLFSIVLLFISPIIHEFSHGIFALLTGNKFFGLRIGNNPINYPLMNANIEIVYLITVPIVLIGGSLGVWIISSFLLMLSKLKRNNYLTFTSLFWILIELFYWSIPLFVSNNTEISDAYYLYDILNINYIIPSIIIFTLFLFIYIYLLTISYRIILSKDK